MREPSRPRWPEPASRSTRSQSTIESQAEALRRWRRRRCLRLAAAPSPALRRPPRPATAALPRRCRGRCGASAERKFSGFLWRTVRMPRRRPCAPGPTPGIIAVAPVGEIVPAFLSGPRVIADLVGRQARRRRSWRRSARKARRPRRDRAARTRARATMRRSACRLDRQLVQREMRRCRAPSAWPSVADQLVLAVAGQRVDEVEADPAEMLLRGFQRARSLRAPNGRGRGRRAPGRRSSAARATGG